MGRTLRRGSMRALTFDGGRLRLFFRRSATHVRPWCAFKKAPTWTTRKTHNAAQVKQHLKQKGLPYINPERTIKH